MVELVEWLRAQLDEEDRLACAAREGGKGEWRQENPDRMPGFIVGDHEGYHVAYDEGYPTAEQAAHIIRHDPARVLREIDAKRQVLALHRPVQRRSTGSGGGAVADCQICGHFPAQYPCATLRLLALPYADRPGYREQWRP